MSSHTPVVTVDGPSGAGKGTLCMLISKQLGFHLLDSGAIYRVLALAAIHHGVDLESEDALVPLATHLDVQFVAEGELVKVILEGEDVSGELRKEETGMAASKVAALPRVREALLRRQRAFAEGVHSVQSVEAQLGEAPNKETLQLVYSENPDLVLNILGLLLKSENVDPQDAIETALLVAPERAEQIAQYAREAGVSNEIITTAALLAGLDPTQVAEATAAGIETASTAALATASAIAPPSVLAVGSNGGGGEGVVSPN